MGRGWIQTVALGREQSIRLWQAWEPTVKDLKRRGKEADNTPHKRRVPPSAPAASRFLETFQATTPCSFRMTGLYTSHRRTERVARVGEPDDRPASETATGLREPEAVAPAREWFPGGVWEARRQVGPLVDEGPRARERQPGNRGLRHAPDPVGPRVPHAPVQPSLTPHAPSL